MIDLHSHILFGLDDGSQSKSQTLRMAWQAWKSGVRKICATPHLPLQEKEKFVETARTTLREARDLLSEEGLGLELYLGFEISLDYSILAEKNLPHFTINENKKYLLCELPFGLTFNSAKDIFYQLLLEGLIPIVAHVERSTFIAEEVTQLEKLVEMGVFFQVNAGSLVGQAGRKVGKSVEKLLEADLVHVIASDAHDETTRSYLTLPMAYSACTKLIGREKALALVENNPLLLLKGTALDERRVVTEIKKES